MDADGGWKKTLRNFGVEAKRAAERTKAQAMSSMGLASKSSDPDPHFEQLAEAHTAQTAAMRNVRDAAAAAIDALARDASAGAALAAALQAALASAAPATPATRAAEAHVAAQRAVTDGALRRAERRLHARVEQPLDDELLRAREVAASLDQRRKIASDYRRYRARVEDFVGTDHSEDAVKADDKLRALQVLSDAITEQLATCMPRRSALIERSALEVAEILRDFHIESASALDPAVVSKDAIASQSATAAAPSEPRTRPSAPSPPSTATADDMFGGPINVDAPAATDSRSSRPLHRKTQAPNIWDSEEESNHASSAEQLPTGASRRSKSSHVPLRPGASIWDEDDVVHVQKPSPNPSPPTSHVKETRRPSMRAPEYYSAGTTAASHSVPDTLRRRGDSSGYPSGGVGQRESSGRESSRRDASLREESSYPSTGTGEKTSLYPSRRAPTTRARRQQKQELPRSTSRDSGLASKNDHRLSEDLLGSFGGSTGAPSVDPTTKPPRQRRSAGTSQNSASTTNLDDLLNLNGGGGSTASSSRPPAGTVDGDLLGVFSSRSTRGAGRGRTRRASSPPPGSQKPSSANGTNLQREELKKKNEAEIKVRAAEKLAAVRERENAKAAEQEKKDDARSGAERRVNQWTGHGARRGNLRALLASLDTVLYTGHTWKPVAMDVLKAPAKVKLNYRKAILQVHPDKIGPKNLPPDQQMLAELIFDELQNGYEVFVAEQEGRAPPPGSVGPKKAANSGGGGGFGHAGGAGMYSGMGRGMAGMGGMGMGGMGNMNNMGGMGARAGMGGMGGMGMGGMGMGRGMSGMGGMGMGGRGNMNGYGNMYGAQQANGRGNMPFGSGRAYGMGMNQQQRR